MHPFLERKGWRAVPAAKPRCGVIRDKVVGNANSVSDKTVGATCCPLGPRLARRQASQEHGRFRRQPTIFRNIPGESSGVGPRDWEKNRRPYCRESSEPHQGDIQGEHPLDHFCILFLREKDVPARHERRTTCRWRKSRCGAMGNLVACDAAVSQIKLRARLAAR